MIRKYMMFLSIILLENKSNIDDVWAGGKFQPTKIAELAGAK